MKKLFLAAALLAASLGAQAQSYTITWPSVADGQAQGWQAHSWTTDSYIIPAGTTLMDNEYLTVSTAVDTPVFGVWSTYEETNPLYVYWGSQKNQDESGYYDDIYSAASIARQDHGIIQVTAKQSGRMTCSYSMGSNLRSFYVYQLPTEDEENNGVYGYYVMCSTTNSAGIHTSAFNVRADRSYLIISSGSGNQLYGMTYDAPGAEGYTATDIPASPYNVVKPLTEADGLAAGYAAHSWGSGYVLPANTVMFDNDDITVTNMVDCAVFPQTFGGHGPGTNAGYNTYLYFGSQLDNNYKDDIYSAASIARQDHGIISISPKVDGRVVLAYSAGNNSRTCYVWRVATDTEIAEGEYGAYVLSNFTDIAGVQTPAFDVMAGNEYYIVCGGSGNSLYAIGFANVDTQTTTGIENVVTSTTAAPADNKIYTIDGRYVGTKKDGLAKGLYIQNGKKFIVK